MNKSNLVPYVDVIRSIESASMAELRAIARVENAILQRPDQEESPPATPKVFDARKARRESARTSTEQANATSNAISTPLQSLEKALERNTAAIASNASDNAVKATTSAQPVATDTQSAISVGAAARYSAPVESNDDLADEQLSATEETNELIKGMWKDDQNRWRTENGAFATRKQKEAMTGKKVSEETPKERGIAAKLLSWVNGQLTDKSENEAVDAAGVAVGSSYWMAGKEAAQLARSFKDFAEQNQINSKEGIKEKLSSAWTKVTSPKSWFGASEAATPETEKGKSSESQNKQVADNKAIDSVNRSAAIPPMNAQSIRQQDAKSDATTEAIEEQTEAFTVAIAKTTAAIEALKLNAGDSGPGLLETAADFLGDRKKRGRGRVGRNGTKPSWRDRLRGRATGGSAGAQRMPNRMGSYTGMGTGPSSMGTPAVRNRAVISSTAGRVGMYSNAAGAAGGVAAAGKAGGVMGKLGGAARMGGAVLSKLALPLTIAMAAYDGISGYNDKEGQQRTFGLKDGQEASVGQKSAMAAGSVLSAGGLSEMLFGVSGDDIAKSLYDFFSDGESTKQTVISQVSGGAPAMSAGAFNVKELNAAVATGVVKPAAQNATSKNAPAIQSSSGVPAYLAAAQPPAPPPAAEPVRAEQKPALVMAQLDPQSLKALEASRAPAPAAKGPSQPRSADTIKMQSDKIGQQIPLSASDEHMRLQALDRA